MSSALHSATASETRRDTAQPQLSLTETLRRALTELDASAVGVARPGGGKPKYFTRSAAAARFFEDVCASGLDALFAQASASNTTVGTNRVRFEPNGPVLGRLIAFAVRDSEARVLSLLLAVRSSDQARFGSRESALLANLAPSIAAHLSPRREPAVPVRKPSSGAAGPTPSTQTVPPLPEVSPLTDVTGSLSATGASAELTALPADIEAALFQTPAADNVVAQEKPTAGDSSAAQGKPAAADEPVAQTPAAAEERTPEEVVPAGETAAEASAELVAPVVPEKPAVMSSAAALAPRTPTASLLTWSDFERYIRAQETLDRISGCVLYGDLDQLHVLNKIAGFSGGDRAIAETCAVLQTANLPDGARACHLSGDRFTVYVPRTTLAQARRYAEQLCRNVSTLFIEAHGVKTPLSISFGVAVIPGHEGGLGHALAAAEAACKAAKDRGRGRVEVYQDADHSIVQRNDDVLVADTLRQALEAGRLEILAQPIVRLSGNNTAERYELLVRLIGEAGTRLSPAWFMSAATRYRMLAEIDRTVLGQVFASLESHRELLATRDVRFSVNLSGPSIGDPDFLEWLMARIGGNGVPGKWLQFEITEMAAVANVAQTQTLIRKLHARGVQFALDDFGTGVSSLAYLKLFDVAMLKLDGSFVRDLLINSRSESLVRGIAQLGRGMGIETVAECVETPEVRERLLQLGIDGAQGFLFGKPAPLEELFTSLASRASGAG